jgi:uncharacterized protein (DUF427 family)
MPTHAALAHSDSQQPPRMWTAPKEHLAMTIIRIDPTLRRIRARLGPTWVADSTRAKLVYVEGRHPEYFIPVDDIDWDLLETRTTEGATTELGSQHPVANLDGETVGQRYIEGTAGGLVHLNFDSMDAWFEEDEQIWVHPRDPYRRVDVLESSRHIDVTVNRVTVASTDRPRLVAETGLPGRWYIPRVDVDWSLLERSATDSYCQYKGAADWWNVTIDDCDTIVDVMWGYERPVTDASKLAGLVAFYAEHDAIDTIVDGTSQIMPGFDPTMLSPSLHLHNLVE